MLAELSTQVNDFLETSKQYIPQMLLVMAALWLFNIINWSTGSKLNRLGIRPRKAFGLIGIPLAPFLHGGFNHLLFNSIPLFFLGLFVMSLNLRVFFQATIIITLLAGFGVWCVGRKGIHIGASALIAGYFGFILVSAYQKPTFAALFCAAIAMYYFGGILFSLFPTGEKATSWEGHLCGFLGGVIAFFICANYQEYLDKIPLMP
ncbi:MAG: rhomboid family intramembrane serine protease [Candidatus Berkiella sp.]